MACAARAPRAGRHGLRLVQRLSAPGEACDGDKMSQPALDMWRVKAEWSQRGGSHSVTVACHAMEGSKVVAGVLPAVARVGWLVGKAAPSPARSPKPTVPAPGGGCCAWCEAWPQWPVDAFIMGVGVAECVAVGLLSW